MTKNIKFETWMRKLNFSCWVTKPNMFQLKMKTLSWVLDEKCECNPRSVGRSHGKFDEWKSFQVGRNVDWVEIESVEVSEKLSFRTWNSFLTWKFGLETKNLSNLMLDPLFLTQMSSALTPKLLSHSPKEKWRKWFTKGWNMGFIYM